VNIEQAIYQILKNDTGVTDFVDGRIFAGIWKQEVTTYPGIVYRPPADGGRREVRTLPGGCTLVEQRMQVFSAAKKYGPAAELDYAVTQALGEFRNTVTNTELSPEEALDIQGIYLDAPAHGHSFEDKSQVHQFLSEFLCFYIDTTRLSS
jgi:hypothetical protein